MSTPPSADSPSRTGRILRGMVPLIFALSVTAMSCGSPERQTEVLGEVEQQANVEPQEIDELQGIDEKQGMDEQRGNGATTEVHLIEAVCITNTPTHEPC